MSHLIAVACAALAAPIAAKALLIYTYRTDRALIGCPVPSIALSLIAATAAIAATLGVTGAAAGWSPAAAVLVGGLFACAFCTDAAGFVLPDLLSAAVGLSGMVLAVIGGGIAPEAAVLGMCCLAIVLGVVRPILVERYGQDAWCLGDFKFVTASAAFIPVAQIAAAFIVAAPLALILILVKGRAINTALPFGSIYVASLAVITITAACAPFAIPAILII